MTHLWTVIFFPMFFLNNENQLSKSLFYTQNGFFLNCGSFHCSAFLKDSYGRTKPSIIVVLDCWMHSGLLCVLQQTWHHYLPNLHYDHIILLQPLKLTIKLFSHMISNYIIMTVQQVFEPLTCYGPFTMLDVIMYFCLVCGGQLKCNVYWLPFGIA